LRLLLDTNALFWVLTAPDRLSAEATAAIETEANDVFVSVVSPWELAIKASHGKLRAPDDLESQFTEKRFEILPVAMRHTRAVESLPHHHGDPFDRMLVAQAQVDGMTIVTSDRKMRRYQVALMPAL
jgi:PIN domain nuclease of toxin-antitoxin system